MRFTDPTLPREDAPVADDPAVMHIGGGRGRAVRAAAGWIAAAVGVAGVLVGFFVWFGTTVGWAAVVVGLMLGYMAAMAKWAGGDDRR